MLHLNNPLLLWLLNKNGAELNLKSAVVSSIAALSLVRLQEHMHKMVSMLTVSSRPKLTFHHTKRRQMTISRIKC